MGRLIVIFLAGYLLNYSLLNSCSVYRRPVRVIRAERLKRESSVRVMNKLKQCTYKNETQPPTMEEIFIEHAKKEINETCGENCTFTATDIEGKIYTQCTLNISMLDYKYDDIASEILDADVSFNLWINNSADFAQVTSIQTKEYFVQTTYSVTVTKAQKISQSMRQEMGATATYDKGVEITAGARAGVDVNSTFSSDETSTQSLTEADRYKLTTKFLVAPWHKANFYWAIVNKNINFTWKVRMIVQGKLCYFYTKKVGNDTEEEMVADDPSVLVQYKKDEYEVAEDGKSLIYYNIGYLEGTQSINAQLDIRQWPYHEL